MSEFRSTTNHGQPALEAALEALAEEILCSIVEDGFCTVQDWDHRIDCCVRLPDGQVIGEMVPLATLTPAVIRIAGERLNRHMQDRSFDLHNELTPPILISRGST